MTRTAANYLASAEISPEEGACFRTHVLGRTMSYAAQIIRINGGTTCEPEIGTDTASLGGLIGFCPVKAVCTIDLRDRVTLTVEFLHSEGCGPQTTRISLHDTRGSIRRAFRKVGMKI
jgi:hypothetical protein